MPTTLNRDAFERLMTENLDWLLRQPRSLERDHVEMLLRDATRVYYDLPGSHLARRDRVTPDVETHLCTSPPVVTGYRYYRPGDSVPPQHQRRIEADELLPYLSRCNVCGQPSRMPPGFVCFAAPTECAGQLIALPAPPAEKVDEKIGGASDRLPHGTRHVDGEIRIPPDRDSTPAGSCVTRPYDIVGGPVAGAYARHAGVIVDDLRPRTRCSDCQASSDVQAPGDTCGRSYSSWSSTDPAYTGPRCPGTMLQAPTGAEDPEAAAQRPVQGPEEQKTAPITPDVPAVFACGCEVNGLEPVVLCDEAQRLRTDYEARPDKDLPPSMSPAATAWHAHYGLDPFGGALPGGPCDPATGYARQQSRDGRGLTVIEFQVVDARADGRDPNRQLLACSLDTSHQSHTGFMLPDDPCPYAAQVTPLTRCAGTLRVAPLPKPET